MNNSTNTDLAIFSFCTFLGLLLIGLIIFDRVKYGPAPETPEPTYTTADGLHHGCSLEFYSGIIKNSTWKLTCPDGYVQHNGNYTVEKH